jgi:hypothetical protein
MNCVEEIGEDMSSSSSINTGAYILQCLHSLKSKRKFCHLEERPDSPAPSLGSEAPDSSTLPLTKRPKLPMQRRVSFDVDKNDNLNTRFNTFDRYDRAVASDIWWSRGDLKKILKREGRLVLNLKIDASKKGDASCMANALKQSINETFKKCVDAPLALTHDEDSPAIFEFIQDEGTHPNELVNETTTTRGLERYIAPIMGAHREMVVKSLLITQGQLSNSDPNLRMEVLGSRYEHLSKIAANFAVVMGQCDAKLATSFQ